MNSQGYRLPSTPGGHRREVDEVQLLHQALLGDIQAVQQLVGHLMPTIQCNVARTLLASGARDRRQDVSQEVEDLCQDVLEVLFERQARVLRAWTSIDGASLRSFVASISRRKTSATLRVRKRNPYELIPTEDKDLERANGSHTIEDRLAASQVHERALRGLLDAQTDKGRAIAQWILVDDHDNERVAELASITPAAAYQWRSRLKRQLAERVEALLRESDLARSPS